MNRELLFIEEKFLDHFEFYNDVTKESLNLVDLNWEQLSKNVCDSQV